MPIASPDINPYPIVPKLPGAVFDLRKTNQNEMTYDKSGNLLLAPGDYVMPVMTYCMKQGGSSPEGHIYSLSKLSGKRAKIIRDLNLKGLSKYSSHDLQIVSWSLQAGLSFEEMTEESQRIIDDVLHEYKPELKESFLQALDRKLDYAPELKRRILDGLGKTGEKIKELQRFRSRLNEDGHDYSSLSELIEITSSDKKGKETPWSKISENVFARFVTERAFQEIGLLEFRIINQSRKVSSTSEQKVSVDIASLFANPNSDDIQPLSFSPLYGFAGIVTTSALRSTPVASAALLAALLASQRIDWDAFIELQELLENSRDKWVQEELEKGHETLRKEHDELEKPLKEAGIISGKDKRSSVKESKKVRQYTRPGGSDQMNKDFEKIKGVQSKGDSGVDVKTLPDGTKIIKRPKTDKQDATIEIQPQEGNSQYPDSRIRVKVRYQ